jgi:hypothetical protein
MSLLFGMSCFNEVLRIAGKYLDCITDTDIANYARTHVFSKDRHVVMVNCNPAGWSVIRIQACRDISVSHRDLDYSILVRRNRLRTHRRRFGLRRVGLASLGASQSAPKLAATMAVTKSRTECFMVFLLIRRVPII